MVCRMMKKVNKDKCCGCENCINICPNNAIILKSDEEGFSYPLVDFDKCINCGLCIAVCPYMDNQGIESYSIYDSEAYVGRLTNGKEISEVQSGGFCTCISRYIISLGGVVYATYFDKYTCSARYERFNNIEKIVKTRGSVYVQSHKDSIVKEIEKDVNNGKEVFVIGLPCDIYAIRKWLKVEHNNIHYCQLFCQGVSSEKGFWEYINEKVSNKEIESLRFRRKNNLGTGWKNGYFSIKYEDGSEYWNRFNRTELAFMVNQFTRVSCMNCKFKKGALYADFAVGDYWGKTAYYDDDKGTSVVLIQTDYGRSLVNKLTDFEFVKIDLENAIDGNPYVIQSYIPEKRQLYSDCYKKSGMFYAYKKLVPLSLRIRRWCAAVLEEIYQRFWKHFYRW